MSSVRIAIVTDIHHGEKHLTKVGPQALPLLAEFCRFVADVAPNAVIDLGDRISDTDLDTDLRLEREVAEAFRPIRQPVFHICGNHDVHSLSVAENEEIFGQPLGHQTVDLGTWRIVLWRAQNRVRSLSWKLDEADLIWLASIVRNADRPLAVMSHVPVSGQSQMGNYWFENNPTLATHPGSERIRHVLRTAHVPVVWFSGHVHWNTVTIVGGIPHVTVQSLTESFITAPEPAATWGILELDEHISWEAFGREPFRFGTSTAAAARRWVTPLPRFDQV